MAHVLFQTILWMDSGLPEDYAVNSWHIETTLTDPTTGAVAFQSDITTFFLAIDAYLSAELQGTVAFKAYNMDDPEPRVPFLIDGAALTPSTTKLPSEVALCMSFQGERTSGVDQRNRRGRVYIGPLGTNALDSATGRPAGAFITALAAAGDALLADSNSDTSYSWVVHSNVLGTSAIVDNGWVDNAFDTQRRRGIAPSSRTTFDG